MASTGPRQRPEPSAIDTRTSTAGLRTIAIFEAIKGVLVIALGFGLLTLMHKDIGEVAENLVRHLHMNPERRFAQSFIHAASKLTDSRLWAIVAGGLVYAIVRFVEAYGLWHRRVWAEWFALLSGSLYLPWEIFELGVKPTPIRATVLIVNLGIVLYMLYVRLEACRPVREPIE